MATYKDLVNTHAEQFDIPKVSASMEIDAVMHSLWSVLVERGEVVLPNFGKLTLVKSPARTGRDPRTGNPVEIPEKTKVRLRVFKSNAKAIDTFGAS